MPNIAAKVFGGMNDNKSLTDMSVVKAETIKNFEIGKKIGKLRKRNGLTDNFASYPWTTIDAIFKMEVTKPSAQTIFVVHATTSGVKKIYIRPYLDWDGATWTDAWHELTEGVESLTLTAATTATNVAFTSPTPDTNDDYYNNWVVCNFTQDKQALVSDYSESGGTGTITLTSPGIVGQTSADTVSLYRFPLIFQSTGLMEADVGSASTTIVDANDSTFTELLETRARVNDYYNGWTVYRRAVITVNNPGFETPDAGADIWLNWDDDTSDGGTLANETTVVRSGTDSCKAQTTAGPATCFVRSDNIAVTAGQQYIVTFYHTMNGDVEYPKYGIRNATSGVTDIVTVRETDNHSFFGWKRQDVVFTVPAGCSNINIELHSSTNDGTGVYFDDVSMVQIGSSTTVTDFESSPFSAWGKAIYTLSADISIVDGDEFAIYNAARTLNIDDVDVVYSSNKAIITVGSDYSYPTQFPLWYGYIREHAFFSSSRKNLPGYYLYPAPLDAPDDDIIADLQKSTGAGDLDDAGTLYWFVRVAYVYEGGQIGPMTSIEKAISNKLLITSGDNKDLTVTLDIGFNNGPCQRFNRIMDYRIKAVRIYLASNAATFDLTDEYYFMEEVQIRGDSPNLKTASDQGADEWDGSDPYSIHVDISNTDWTNKGSAYTTDAGISADSARITTQANYKHRIDLTTRSVIANVNVDEKEFANLLYSTITADGNYSVDVHPPLQTIPLGRYGAIDIRGIFSFVVFEEQLNRIVVFDRNIIARLRIATASTFDFEIEKIITERGCGSNKSIAKVDRFLFYYSPKVGVCMYDGNRVHIISNLPNASIQRALDAITTDSYHENAIGWYYPRMRQYWLHIQTGGSTFRVFKYQMYDGVSMLGGEWIEDSYPNQLVGGFVDKVGDLYIADTTQIYKADDPTATDDDGTDIVPEWKSKLIQPDEENEIDFHEMYAFYRSDTAIDVNPYLDGSGTEIALVNESWAAKTTLGKGENKIQIGLGIGEQLQLEAEIPAASQGTNTYFDLDEIGIVFDVLEKVR